MLQSGLGFFRKKLVSSRTVEETEKKRKKLEEINQIKGALLVQEQKCSKFEVSKLNGDHIVDQFGMDAFKKGWFTETGTLNEDQALSMKVDKVLYHEKSKYQDVLVFDSKRYGRTLVLDNAIQCTESDECSYQEMITFLPLNSHPNPKKILIIGGGDGGVVREAVKHPSVESVTLCEIDEKVIEVSKKYLPFMAKGFLSPKLTLHIGDGAEFVKHHENEFDVIITDSSDPKGPAVCLFRKPYYESLKKALKPGGIISSQGECFWFDLELIKDMMKMCRTLFPVVDYGSCYVSSYPGGQIGFFLCSTNPETNFREPLHRFTSKMLKELGLRYYTPDIHKAAFALPLYIADTLELSWEVSFNKHPESKQNEDNQDH